MKFLCVPCDEAMKLEEVEGPEQGSLTVVFHCPQCLHRIALLTNPWETQLVKALDVKIGGRSVPSEPLEFIRGSLAKQREGAFVDSSTVDEIGGCPFAAVVREAEEPIWTGEAEKRLERIPGFVRSWAKKAIEGFAREKGYRTITEEVMDEAREKIGM